MSGSIGFITPGETGTFTTVFNTCVRGATRRILHWTKDTAQLACRLLPASCQPSWLMSLGGTRRYNAGTQTTIRSLWLIVIRRSINPILQKRLYIRGIPPPRSGQISMRQSLVHTRLFARTSVAVFSSPPSIRWIHELSLICRKIASLVSCDEFADPSFYFLVRVDLAQPDATQELSLRYFPSLCD